MSAKILLLHHDKEEDFAAQLAKPIREAGYELFCHDTVIVGKSLIGQTNDLISEGALAILCATERAMGTTLLKKQADAARTAAGILLVAQMEEGADVSSFALDEKFACCWTGKDAAIQSLVESIQKHRPIPTERIMPNENLERRASYPTKTEEYLQRQLKKYKEKVKGYANLSGKTQIWDPPLSLKYAGDPPEFEGLNKQSGKCTQKEADLASIGEALDLHEHFVLLGAPGSGKTTTLEKLLVDQARKAMENLANARIPVFINLVKWPAAFDDFSRFLAQEMSFQVIGPVSVDRTLLLLDGLNEIAAEHYSARVKALGDWLKDYPESSVIVSSREKHYLDGRKIATLPTVHIQPLDNNRIRAFLNARLGSDIAEKLFPQLGSLDSSIQLAHKHKKRDLIFLAQNPYLLQLICRLYEDNEKQMPGSRGDLFRCFVNMLYAREKRHSLTFDITYDQMLSTFSEIAFAMQRNRSATSVHTNWAVKQITAGIDIEKVWVLGRNSSLLELEKDERVLHFSHQLILEYFAAEGLLKRFNDLGNYVRHPKFYGGRRLSGSWDEVMFTLAGLIDSDEYLRKLAEIDPFLAFDCLEYIPKNLNLSDNFIGFIVDKLVSYFSSNNSDAKSLAITKLQEQDESIVLAPLLKILRETKNVIIKRASLKVLSTYNSSHALEYMVSALRDKDKWVRKESEEFLEKKIQSLTPFLDDDTEDVRTASSSDLAQIESELVLDNRLKEGYSSTAELVPLLAHVNAKTRRIARKALISDINIPTKDVLALMRHKHAKVRLSAAMALSKRFKEITLEKLDELLDDDSPCVITKLLDSFGRHEAILEQKKLLSFLAHSSADVRVVAILSLSLREKDFQVEMILPALNDKNADVRRAALKCLADKSALSVAQIIPYLNDKDGSVRIAAINALIQFSEMFPTREILHFLNDVDENVIVVALKALIVHGNILTAEQVLHFINDTKELVGIVALKALIVHGDNCLIEQVMPRINDKFNSIKSLIRKYLEEKDSLLAAPQGKD